MAEKYAVELLGVKDGTVPKTQSDGTVVGGALQRFRATIAFAADGNGEITSSDNVFIAELPMGHVFAYGVVTSSVSLSTAQVAIGTSQTHATNGQYRAAATFTDVEKPSLFGITGEQRKAPSRAAIQIFLTTSAALPTTGQLVIDIFASSVR